MPDSRNILWIDDEIDLLGAHLIYLRDRGYEITPVTNGPDALALAEGRAFDLALVDEMMPGMSGLEVIGEKKRIKPTLPVVMVTKNEAEELMEQAIGRQVEAFLTKPVNPSQILSVLKGVLDRRQIATSELVKRWAGEFAGLSDLVDRAKAADDWIAVHQRIARWELDLDESGEASLREMLGDIRSAADRRFGKWVEAHYPDWIAAHPGERPVLSMDVVDRHLVPVVRQAASGDAGPVLFLVVDCLRFDHYLALEPLLAEFFDIRLESCLAILPTATPYARNALFSGFTPAELERVHTDLWARGDEDESSSNRHERAFLAQLLMRRGLDLKPEAKYVKVLEAEEATDFERRLGEYLAAPLTSMVYNFVDILVHTRQSVEVIKEMIPDEAAFRSVARAWFGHSSLYRILKAYGEKGGTVVLTSDHGAIRVRRAVQVIGDRTTSTSLRYKHGRNLKVDPKQSIVIKDPPKWGLPQRGINTEYILSREDQFFLYPTNFHHYFGLYRDSFQHGGVSLEEMVLPVAILKGKGK